MAGSDHVPPDVSRIADDHEGLHSFITRLEQMFETEPADVSAMRDAGQNLLREFRTVLEEHWALEEEGGLLGDMNRRRPALLSKEKALFDEHAVLREAINALVTAAGAVGQADGVSPANLRSQIRDFVDRLEAHEAAERELMSDVYYTDLGGGD